MADDDFSVFDEPVKKGGGPTGAAGISAPPAMGGLPATTETGAAKAALSSFNPFSGGYEATKKIPVAAMYQKYQQGTPLKELLAAGSQKWLSDADKAKAYENLAMEEHPYISMPIQAAQSVAAPMAGKAYGVAGSLGAMLTRGAEALPAFGLGAGQAASAGGNPIVGGAIQAAAPFAEEAGGRIAAKAANAPNWLANRFAAKGQSLIDQGVANALPKGEGAQMQSISMMRSPEQQALAKAANMGRGDLAVTQLMGPDYQDMTINEMMQDPVARQKYAEAVNKIGRHAGAAEQSADALVGNVNQTMAANGLSPESSIADLLDKHIGTTDVMSDAAQLRKTMETNGIQNLSQLDPDAQAAYDSLGKLQAKFQAGNVSRMGGEGAGGQAPYTMRTANPAAMQVHAQNVGRDAQNAMANKLLTYGGSGAAGATMFPQGVQQAGQAVGGAAALVGGAMKPAVQETVANMIGGAGRAGIKLNQYYAPNVSASMLDNSINDKPRHQSIKDMLLSQ